MDETQSKSYYHQAVEETIKNTQESRETEQETQM
jgi:hypothetical protein